MGSDVEKPAYPDLPTHAKQEPKAKLKPQRECFCRLLNIVTALCALLCLVAHCMAFAVGPTNTKNTFHDVAGLLQQALRVYGVVFSVLIILTETEFDFFLRSLRLLDNWLARGFFQLFEAVLTLELSRSTAQGTTDFHKSLRLYRLVAGTSLLACSGIYILGGILCWGRHKARARYQREAERQRVLEDIEALDHKRHELKGLLAVYSNH